MLLSTGEVVSSQFVQWHHRKGIPHKQERSRQPWTKWELVAGGAPRALAGRGITGENRTNPGSIPQNCV